MAERTEATNLNPVVVLNRIDCLLEKIEDNRKKGKLVYHCGKQSSKKLFAGGESDIAKEDRKCKADCSTEVCNSLDSNENRRESKNKSKFAKTWKVNLKGDSKKRKVSAKGRGKKIKLADQIETESPLECCQQDLVKPKRKQLEDKNGISLTVNNCEQSEICKRVKGGSRSSVDSLESISPPEELPIKSCRVALLKTRSEQGGGQAQAVSDSSDTKIQPLLEPCKGKKRSKKPPEKTIDIANHVKECSVNDARPSVIDSKSDLDLPLSVEIKKIPEKDSKTDNNIDKKANSPGILDLHQQPDSSNSEVQITDDLPKEGSKVKVEFDLASCLFSPGPSKKRARRQSHPPARNANLSESVALSSAADNTRVPTDSIEKNVTNSKEKDQYTETKKKDTNVGDPKILTKEKVQTKKNSRTRTKSDTVVDTNERSLSGTMTSKGILKAADLGNLSQTQNQLSEPQKMTDSRIVVKTEQSYRQMDSRNVVKVDRVENMEVGVRSNPEYLRGTDAELSRQESECFLNEITNEEDFEPDYIYDGDDDIMSDVSTHNSENENPEDSNEFFTDERSNIVSDEMTSHEAKAFRDKIKSDTRDSHLIMSKFLSRQEEAPLISSSYSSTKVPVDELSVEEIDHDFEEQLVNRNVEWNQSSGGVEDNSEKRKVINPVKMEQNNTVLSLMADPMESDAKLVSNLPQQSTPTSDAATHVSQPSMQHGTPTLSRTASQNILSPVSVDVRSMKNQSRGSPLSDPVVRSSEMNTKTIKKQPAVPPVPELGSLSIIPDSRSSPSQMITKKTIPAQSPLLGIGCESSSKVSHTLVVSDPKSSPSQMNANNSITKLHHRSPAPGNHRSPGSHSSPVPGNQISPGSHRSPAPGNHRSPATPLITNKTVPKQTLSSAPAPVTSSQRSESATIRPVTKQAQLINQKSRESEKNNSKSNIGLKDSSSECSSLSMDGQNSSKNLRKPPCEVPAKQRESRDILGIINEAQQNQGSDQVSDPKSSPSQMNASKSITKQRSPATSLNTNKTIPKQTLSSAPATCKQRLESATIRPVSQQSKLINQNPRESEKNKSNRNIGLKDSNGEGSRLSVDRQNSSKNVRKPLYEVPGKERESIDILETMNEAQQNQGSRHFVDIPKSDSVSKTLPLSSKCSEGITSMPVQCETFVPSSFPDSEVAAADMKAVETSVESETIKQTKKEVTKNRPLGKKRKAEQTERKIKMNPDLLAGIKITFGSVSFQRTVNLHKQSSKKESVGTTQDKLEDNVGVLDTPADYLPSVIQKPLEVGFSETIDSRDNELVTFHNDQTVPVQGTETTLSTAAAILEEPILRNPEDDSPVNESVQNVGNIFEVMENLQANMKQDHAVPQDELGKKRKWGKNSFSQPDSNIQKKKIVLRRPGQPQKSSLSETPSRKIRKPNSGGVKKLTKKISVEGTSDSVLRQTQNPQTALKRNATSVQLEPNALKRTSEAVQDLNSEAVPAAKQKVVILNTGQRKIVSKSDTSREPSGTTVAQRQNPTATVTSKDVAVPNTSDLTNPVFGESMASSFVVPLAKKADNVKVTSTVPLQSKEVLEGTRTHTTEQKTPNAESVTVKYSIVVDPETGKKRKIKKTTTRRWVRRRVPVATVSSVAQNQGQDTLSECSFCSSNTEETNLSLDSVSDRIGDSPALSISRRENEKSGNSKLDLESEIEKPDKPCEISRTNELSEFPLNDEKLLTSLPVKISHGFEKVETKDEPDVNDTETKQSRISELVTKTSSTTLKLKQPKLELVKIDEDSHFKHITDALKTKSNKNLVNKPANTASKLKEEKTSERLAKSRKSRWDTATSKISPPKSTGHLGSPNSPCCGVRGRNPEPTRNARTANAPATHADGSGEKCKMSSIRDLKHSVSSVSDRQRASERNTRLSRIIELCGRKKNFSKLADIYVTVTSRTRSLGDFMGDFIQAFTRDNGFHNLSHRLKAFLSVVTRRRGRDFSALDRANITSLGLRLCFPCKKNNLWKECHRILCMLSECGCSYIQLIGHQNIGLDSFKIREEACVSAEVCLKVGNIERVGEILEKLGWQKISEMPLGRSTEGRLRLDGLLEVFSEMALAVTRVTNDVVFSMAIQLLKHLVTVKPVISKLVADYNRLLSTALRYDMPDVASDLFTLSMMDAPLKVTMAVYRDMVKYFYDRQQANLRYFNEALTVMNHGMNDGVYPKQESHSSEIGGRVILWTGLTRSEIHLIVYGYLKDMCQAIKLKEELGETVNSSEYNMCIEIQEPLLRRLNNHKLLEQTRNRLKEVLRHNLNPELNWFEMEPEIVQITHVSVRYYISKHIAERTFLVDLDEDKQQPPESVEFAEQPTHSGSFEFAEWPTNLESVEFAGRPTNQSESYSSSWKMSSNSLHQRSGAQTLVHQHGGFSADNQFQPEMHGDSVTQERSNVISQQERFSANSNLQGYCDDNTLMQTIPGDCSQPGLDNLRENDRHSHDVDDSQAQEPSAGNYNWNQSDFSNDQRQATGNYTSVSDSLEPAYLNRLKQGRDHLLRDAQQHSSSQRFISYDRVPQLEQESERNLQQTCAMHNDVDERYTSPSVGTFSDNVEDRNARVFNQISYGNDNQKSRYNKEKFKTSNYSRQSFEDEYKQKSFEDEYKQKQGRLCVTIDSTNNNPVPVERRTPQATPVFDSDCAIPSLLHMDISNLRADHSKVTRTTLLPTPEYTDGYSSLVDAEKPKAQTEYPGELRPRRTLLPTPPAFVQPTEIQSIVSEESNVSPQVVQPHEVNQAWVSHRSTPLTFVETSAYYSGISEEGNVVSDQTISPHGVEHSWPSHESMGTFQSETTYQQAQVSRGQYNEAGSWDAYGQSSQPPPARGILKNANRGRGKRK